jgi:aryl-alcohol dehydrogenase-like predicted oxidoreductase
MHTRTLPGTDLALSVVGMGCWGIGGEHWGEDGSDARSEATVRAALEHGINWFDTAPIYGWGHSEEVLGRALGAERSQVVIASKVGVERVEGHARSHLSAEILRADLEASLGRLGRDCIDLLQVHWPCELNTPLEESFGALAQLQAEGKFRYLGVCNYGAEALERIAQITPVVSLQVGYSLLRREIEGGLVQTAQSLGMGVLAYEPLCRGLLTGKFTGDVAFPGSDMRARDDRFQGHRFTHGRGLAADLGRVAQKLGVPTSAVAIGWVAQKPGVTAVIAGAKGPEQVAENVRAAEIVGRTKVWGVVEKVAAVWGGTPR